MDLFSNIHKRYFFLFVLLFLYNTSYSQETEYNHSNDPSHIIYIEGRSWGMWNVLDLTYHAKVIGKPSFSLYPSVGLGIYKGYDTDGLTFPVVLHSCFGEDKFKMVFSAGLMTAYNKYMYPYLINQFPYPSSKYALKKSLWYFPVFRLGIQLEKKRFIYRFGGGLDGLSAGVGVKLGK